MLDLAKLREAAQSVTGAPFCWEGEGPAGFDCIGLVLWLYEKAGHPLKVDIPVRGSNWTKIGAQKLTEGLRESINFKALPLSVMPGDVLGFCFGYGPGVITHLGVALDDSGAFVHSFEGRGVMQSSLRQAFWRSSFGGAGRV